MIYFYTRVENHNIEKLHKYLDYFYRAMFAEASTTFALDVLIDPDFTDAVEKYKEQILDKLEKIFNDYFSLEYTEKEIVQQAYQNNNNIEGICRGACCPIKYEELPDGIRDSIKSLYDNLWEPILGYARLVDSCGTVKQHFNDFRIQNPHLVCPFCGLEGLLCEYDDGRDDYDHYIPKAQYPFNCVNFSNLIPMCHHCNSKNKGQVDPVFTKDRPPARRILFYPFENNGSQTITIRIDASTIDLTGDDWDIEIDCEPLTIGNKVNAWNEIFRIKKRYQAPIRKTSSLLKGHAIKKFKRWRQRPDYTYEAFKEDLLDEIFDIKERKNGIIDKAVYDFFFSQPDFESWLSGQI